jgi:hypothetical protein
MTRQFHARVRKVSPPKARVAGPHTLSFVCYRLVPVEPGEYETVELCDPRNAMRAFLV